jgi:hypothetical protein
MAIMSTPMPRLIQRQTFTLDNGRLSSRAP